MIKNNVPDNCHRRDVLKMAGLLAAGSLFSRSPLAATRREFRIGFVSPRTGPLSIFAEPDMFVIEQVRRTLGDGIAIDGVKYPVEILYRDSESDPLKAAAQAQELIMQYQVDLMLASSTPATTNPVADQCERFGVPCLTNDTPWQAHFFGRGGDPKKGFDWTFHFFWGMEDILSSFTNLWQQVDSNRKVGMLWLDDADGQVWSDRKLGFPPVLAEKGFQLIDPGHIGAQGNYYPALVDRFKRENVDIITGVIPPPDFALFWKEAQKQKLAPKITTVAKASEFPAALLPFRSASNGLSVEVWWSPSHPYVSHMTGQSSADLAREYTDVTGRNWTMPLGCKHALFEVAINALRHSQGPGRLASIRDALAATDYSSVIGPINFRTGPVPNVSKTPLVCGQWEYRYRNLELLIVENSGAPEIPLQARLHSMTV
jgi:branched-chain amino acid transport system substrate-binding protein